MHVPKKKFYTCRLISSKKTWFREVKLIFHFSYTAIKATEMRRVHTDIKKKLPFVRFSQDMKAGFKINSSNCK